MVEWTFTFRSRTNVTAAQLSKLIFRKPKGHMGVCRFHSNWQGEVEKAIREWLQMEEPYFYRHGILLLVAR
jgi:hypothetical protein